MQETHSRQFETAADVSDLHDLLAATWRAGGPAVTFHVGDLHWRLRPQPGRDPKLEIRLWYGQLGYGQSEQLAGFAWHDCPGEGDTVCHPDADRPKLEPQLLAWLEERSRAAGARTLTVGGFEKDDFRVTLLRSRGYQRENSCVRHMQFQPDTASIDRGVADGYHIRPATVADVPHQAATIAVAFADENVPASIDTLLSVRAGAHYRNDLDLIAVAADGTVAAFCRAWLDPANRAGLLEPVGCHPEHRRLGLAGAVVAAASRRLLEIGAESLLVCPRSDNERACALYQSAGYVSIADDYHWTRPADGGTPPST